MSFDIQQAKGAMWAAFNREISRAGLNGKVIIERPDSPFRDWGAYYPDVVVLYGKYTPHEDADFEHQIVIDIIPSSKTAQDWAGKLDQYFKSKRIEHYLVVDLNRRVVVHHQPGTVGQIETNLIAEGNLYFEPPGLIIPLKLIFGP